MAHDVFISYSVKDKSIADTLCSTLEAGGARCWISSRDVLPGMDWGEAIIDAIAASRIMVLLLSANSNASTHVKREVERAVNKNIIVIPFHIENVTLSKPLEYHLSSTHWINAFTPPLEKHLRILAESIRQLLSISIGPAPKTVPSATAKKNVSLPTSSAPRQVILTIECHYSLFLELSSTFHKTDVKVILDGKHIGTIPKLNDRLPKYRATPLHVLRVETTAGMHILKLSEAGVLLKDERKGWLYELNLSSSGNYKAIFTRSRTGEKAWHLNLSKEHV